MIQRIKRGDKLYIVSSELDVVSHLKPNEVQNKYIEIKPEDLIEGGKGTAKTYRLPVLKYDCSSNKIKPQTFAVVFHPQYKLGMTLVEAGKGDSILEGVELPNKLDAGSYLIRVYLLDADG